MARRPFDPAAEGWEKVAYRRGDILDRGSLAALFDGADVAVHLAFAIFGGREETRQVNLEGTPQRLRGGDRGRGRAARLRLLGRRLRLPPREPAAADRGGAGPRQRELLLLGPEGRAGGTCSTSCCRGAGWTPTSSGPASSPAAGDDADRADRRGGAARRPAAGCCARGSNGCRCCSRSCPTPASRSSSSTTTTSPGRWRRRSPAPARPAPTTSPARGRSASPTSPARSAGARSPSRPARSALGAAAARRLTFVSLRSSSGRPRCARRS